MQPGIVARIKARLAQHSLGLYLAPIADQDPRANRASVRLDSLQLDLDPVLLAAQVITQQGRGFIEIDDQNIHITIIVEIAEGAPATAVHLGNARTGLGAELFEGSVAQVAKYGSRGLIGVLRQLPFHFWVNVPRNHKKIRVTVVVEVN